MSKVAVIAKIAAQEGKRADLARALQAALDTAQGEVGTEAYILHEDASDANLIFVTPIGGKGA